MARQHPQKDAVITMIEDDSRSGEAFDEKTMEVLYKISVADLFRLQVAFQQSFNYGRAKGLKDAE